MWFDLDRCQFVALPRLNAVDSTTRCVFGTLDVVVSFHVQQEPLADHGQDGGAWLGTQCIVVAPFIKASASGHTE